MSVMKFETPDGAERMLGVLEQAQKQALITVQDAAIVSWPQGAKKPKTRQLHNLAGAGALDGAFWGLLFGLIFFVPILGLAIGAGIGALTASLVDVGIDDDFIKKSRDQITEGTSALFLLSSDAVIDRIQPQVQAAGLKPELISTNLSKEEEDKLREAFVHA
jgi:uncharacterized membrane protein